MKKKKIFIGGFSGSGSRVVQMILERAGYFVGGDDYNNESYDFCGRPVDETITNITRETEKKVDAVWYFNKYYFYNDPKPYKKLLDEVLTGRDHWSIKHGHYMFCVPLLKKWYPDSEFIYVLRNPIDNMLNKFITHNIYGGLPIEAPIENKVKYHLSVTRMALENTDYVVRLEDLCFNTTDAISQLLTFANIPHTDVDNYLDLIETPKSIGRGKEYYEKFKKMKEYSYIKQLGFDLNE